MDKVIRHADGSMISKGEWSAIVASANLVKMDLMHLNCPNPPKKFLPKTRPYYKAYFRKEWNAAVLRLERMQPLLELCATHWKAEHVIGNALHRVDDAGAMPANTGTGGDHDVDMGLGDQVDPNTVSNPRSHPRSKPPTPRKRRRSSVSTTTKRRREVGDKRNGSCANQISVFKGYGLINSFTPLLPDTQVGTNTLHSAGFLATPPQSLGNNSVNVGHINVSPTSRFTHSIVHYISLLKLCNLKLVIFKVRCLVHYIFLSIYLQFYRDNFP
jgi:hypothetical protein